MLSLSPESKRFKYLDVEYLEDALFSDEALTRPELRAEIEILLKEKVESGDWPRCRWSERAREHAYKCKRCEVKER